MLPLGRGGQRGGWTGVGDVPSPALPTGRVLAIRVHNARGTVNCHTLQTAMQAELGRNATAGSVLRIQLWSAKQTHGVVDGLLELSTPEAASLIVNSMNGVEMQVEGGPAGVKLRLSPSTKHAVVRITDPRCGVDYTSGQGQGLCPLMEEPIPTPLAVPPSTGTVVMVSNLIEGTMPQAIFRLFGTCGDVLACKIVYKRRSQALVQYRDAEQAVVAIELLNHCPFYEEGRTLYVSPSHHQTISGPPDELTCYWPADHPLHRFNGRYAQRNLQQRHGPQPQVLLSNVPPELHEQFLASMLQKFGAANQTRWFPAKEGQRSAMCQVLFASVREAVAALIGLHGVEFSHVALPNGRGLIVSFSRSDAGKPLAARRCRGQGGIIYPPDRSPITTTYSPEQDRIEESGH